LNELLPEKIKEFAKFRSFISHIKNLHLFIPFNGMVFHSDRPLEIHLDDDKRIHNQLGSGLLYRDSYSLYAFDGIIVDKKILDNCKDKKSANKILSLKNVEQRLVAIKYFGVENMLKKLKSKSRDKFKEYELLSVEIEGSRENLLKMRNPSEPKTHYEFVPPEINTCQEAMAWRCGFKLYTNPMAHS